MSFLILLQPIKLSIDILRSRSDLTSMLEEFPNKFVPNKLSNIDVLDELDDEPFDEPFDEPDEPDESFDELFFFYKIFKYKSH